MRCLVTGTTGFIGSVLAPRLAELGHDVYCLERYVTGRYCLGKHPALKTVYADLNDYAEVDRHIRMLKPEVIIHLAAISAASYSYDHPLEVQETNYLATVHLAESARRHDPNLIQFLQAGTSECYGNQKLFPITEDARFYPNSPYAVAKVAAVEYLRYMHDAYQFPITIPFNFNTYGRRNNSHFVVERTIKQMLNDSNGKVQLGDPEPIRDFVFVDDHVKSYLLALNNDATIGECFNVATGVGVTIRELTQRIAKLTGFHGEVVWQTIPGRPLDPKCLIGDSSKAWKLLGWKPTVMLNEGLQRTIDGLSEEPRMFVAHGETVKA